MHTMRVVFSFYLGFVLGIRHYEPTEKEPYTEAQFFLGPVCITLTDRNLFKISITENQVEFWINGNQVATHITNLPDIQPYFMIYNASEAGGASTVDLGFCRVFYRGFDDARSF